MSSKVEGKNVLDPSTMESKLNDKNSDEEVDIDGELDFQSKKVEEIIQI